MTVEYLSPQAALTLIEQGATLIDIRDADEYVREHIPMARPFPLSAIEKGQTLPSSDGGVVIFHCQSGNRTRNNEARLVNGLYAVQIWNVTLSGGSISVPEDANQFRPSRVQIPVSSQI